MGKNSAFDKLKLRKQHLASATKENPFYFFKHFNCFYNGAEIIWSNEVLKNADPVTLRKINYRYLADENFVFENGRILKNISGKNFKALSSSSDEIFFKNEDYVFVEEYGKLLIINGADPKSFKTLDFACAKDLNYVYYRNEILFSASDDFVINKCGFIYNTKVIYHYGFQINLDSETFGIIDFESHLKKTNPFIGPYNLKDKNGNYVYNDSKKTLTLLTTTNNYDRNN